MKGHKCDSSCLIGMIMMAAGIVSLVAGFIEHMDVAGLGNWLAWLYYLVGVGLYGHGKHCHTGTCDMGGSSSKRK